MDNQQTPITRLAYTMDEAIEASGVSRDTLYRLIGSGDLASVKIRNRRMIPASALNLLCGNVPSPGQPAPSQAAVR